MIWRLLCPVPVFLSVILTLGCNSSTKQVQPLGFVSDPELMATVQALPEQLLVQGRPTIPPHHPPTVLLPESDIDFKTLAVTPNPRIDYKIASVTPDSGTDYKMLIVPNQGQLRHAIGELEFPLRPKLEVPPVPWKPKKPATEQLLVQGRPTIPPHHPPTILLPESNIDFKTLAVTPNPGIDYKIASVTPDPGTDYKMLIVPNQGQLRHAIGELEFPLRPKLDMPPVPWKPEKPATEQLLVQGRPTIPPHHPPTILLPESNIDFKTLAVTPNPGIDYKIASVTPDPGTDYKMLIVPNQGQLRHAIGELEFPLRPKLDMPPVPWKPKNPQRSNTK